VSERPASLIDPRTYNSRLQRLGLLENPFLDYPDNRYFSPFIEQRLVSQDILTAIAEKPTRNIGVFISDHLTGISALCQRVAGTVAVNKSLNAYSQHFTDSGGIVTPGKMVKQICADLGIEASTQKGRMEALHQRLLSDMHEHGTSLFIAMDGNMTEEALYTIREMANWVSEDRPVRSLVQFALFGTKSAVFYNEFNVPSLFPTTYSVRTMGLPSVQELTTLLEEQARRAGRVPSLFTEDAAEILVERSGRIVGKLLLLASRSLDRLIQTNETVISEQMALEAVLDRTLPEETEPEIDETVRNLLENEE
jgi:hypothetical protein